MPANVETMMYAGATPWHGLGKDVTKEVTSADALKAAGLDWEVGLRDVYILGPKGEQVKFEGAKATVRASDEGQLGIVGDRYRVIQNTQAFDLFDGVVGEKLAIYHTAGSLNGGRRIWILAKLPSTIQVTRDDIVEKYILLSNSHDGTTATRVFWTPVRVVCANTESAALRGFSTKDGISVRHTENAKYKLEEARNVLGLADQYYNKLAERFQQMAKTRFTEKQMKVLVEKDLFPSPEKDGEEISTRLKNIRSTVLDLFDNGKGQRPVRGTIWAAYNAVTEYADHHRATRVSAGGSEAENRLESAWFGAGSGLKQKAFDLLSEKMVEIAKAA
jgi:phage/plasmid-like protein (TIGR03299 family)